MEHTRTLQMLSRQHKEDRLKCRELLRDIQQQRDKQILQHHIIQFWKNELQKHVDAEEAILFPFLQKHHFSYDFVNALKREHDTIRLLAERLPLHNDGPYLYKAFIKLVEQHCYFEDEILFRKMQEDIPPQELAQLDVMLRG
jgi:iron-sulfur cluster repair protein YtfE (RIC family)